MSSNEVSAMRKTKVFEAKNARAVSLLKSWLRAVEVSYQVPVRTGAKVAEVDLIVTSQDGRAVQVQVNSGDSPAASPATTVLDGTVLTGRNIQAARDLFSGFLGSLGYEARSPVDRGALPDGKLDYHDRFEDVSMRHADLHRVPNPSENELLRYEAVMKKAAWTFLRSQGRFCDEHMFEFGDLYTYAMVWTTIYIGYYEVPEHEVTASNNEKKLYSFLSQRFDELRAIGDKKGKNIFATLDVAFLGMHGQVYEWGDKSCWDGNVMRTEERPDDEYVARHNELDLRTPNTRRVSATHVLESKLRALPHDEMINVLKETAKNERLHPDATAEAARRLADHQHGCTACVYLDEMSPTVTPDDQAPGIDPGCCRE